MASICLMNSSLFSITNLTVVFLNISLTDSTNLTIFAIITGLSNGFWYKWDIKNNLQNQEIYLRQMNASGYMVLFFSFQPWIKHICYSYRVFRMSWIFMKQFDFRFQLFSTRILRMIYYCSYFLLGLTYLDSFHLETVHRLRTH